ncbi:MAG: hypothetical protein WCW54_01105 [Candidatus Paceibacterota bacterium]
MFNLFKEKCPVCKMELQKEKVYPEESSKKFCSENCKEEYKKQEASKPEHSGSCCH